MNAATAQPRFIAFDGIDGVGKSTQIQRLADYLRQRGHDVLVVHDPGSTPVGAELRRILLDSDLHMHRRTEALLFMASRCEMIETIIRPAFDAGQIVISDRFLLANVVYQSVGGQVDAETLWAMGHLANDGLQPDLTILLDMPATEAVRRMQQPADRMEKRGVDYLESVRNAFLEQLPNASPQTAVINAAQEVDQVATDIRKIIDPLLDATSIDEPVRTEPSNE